MSDTQSMVEPVAAGNAVVTFGFGTAVAMWGLAYLSRLPIVTAPGWLVAVLLMLALAGGGGLFVWLSGQGRARAALVGLVTATINMLVLGGLISGDSPNAVRPSALFWVPGSMVASVLLVMAGAIVGERLRPPRPRPRNWTVGFALVTVAATGFLLVAGGVVTGYRAGLAVTDWPNSFYYNMFLFPLGRMTGGIYYEHAHRLLGTLVGICTVTLAVLIWVGDRRRWLKWLAVGVVLLVVLQGILGGLRVTGHFTLSADPNDVAPRILLAIVHGIAGQAFFGAVVAIAAFVASRWRNEWASEFVPTARTDRQLGILASAFYIFQLSTGAVVRHMHLVMDGDLKYAPLDPESLYERFLIIHIVMAALMTAVVVAFAVRALTFYRHHRPLLVSARWLIGLLLLQLVLGMAALIAATWDVLPLSFDAFVTTMHQGNGAAVFGVIAVMTVWTFRCVASKPAS